MKKGELYFTGRYIPNSRIVKEEPAGVYEDQIGEGMAELRVEPLSVITITPRPVQRRKNSNIRKALVMLSVIALPVSFVALADLLAASPGLFFGSFAAAFGWPAIVFWANYRD